MPIDIDFSKTTEPRLFTTDLALFVSDPQVVNFGAIMICRHGKVCVRVNFDEWQLYEGAVLTLFPGDVVSLVQHCEFEVEMLQYDAVMLREASLQLEQTVYAVAGRSLPTGFARCYRYHQLHVSSFTRLLRSGGLCLHCPACVVAAQGVLHRIS